MSYTALYRKWRPRRFADVYGQDPIVTTLKNEIKLSRIGHAYLFCGTRGTGKTSVAKIFARAVNCENPVDGEPCGECETCRAILDGSSVNMVEIDAASNNGVDNIREIRDEVQYRPSTGRYRVYIIDEVHMLSTGAFNALLKTLEEPPEYVIFILATTEPHKIPITVLSRCQRYDFRRIPTSTLGARLSEICSAEGIEIEDKALHYIAMKADGSMRDAISLLDECVAFHVGEKLTHEMTLQVLGTADNEVYSSFLRGIIAGDTTACLLQVEQAVMDGRDLMQFTQDFVWYMRNLLLLQTSLTGNELMELTREDWERYREEGESISSGDLMRLIRIFSSLQNSLRNSTGKRVAMDVAVIRATRPEMEPDMDSVLSRVDELERELSSLKKNGVRYVASGAALPAADASAGANVGTDAVGADVFGTGASNTGASDNGAADVQGTSSQAAPQILHLPAAQAEDIRALRGAWKSIVDEFKEDSLVYLYLCKSWLEPRGEGSAFIVFRDFMPGNYIKKALDQIKDKLSEAAAARIGKKVDFDVRVDARSAGESVIEDDDIRSHFVGVDIKIED